MLNLNINLLDMNKFYSLISLLIFLFLSALKIHSQTTSVLVFSEDFQDNVDRFALNVTNPITQNSGTNTWIINNQYIGAPTYPNTISQDSTFGGLITGAPFSRYMHIHDSSSPAVANANWSPASASDRMVVSDEFCTLGLNDVVVAFYYLCQGNSNTYGQLYYSADNGPWTQVGQAQYSNTYKWKYEQVTDPGFSNHQSLRIAYRWVNGPGGATNRSFAVDDIRVVGTYDPAQYPISISITNVTPNPVCQGNNLFIFYNISQPLCGTGNYAVQLSDATGSFANPTGLPQNNSIYVLNNSQASGLVAPIIPGSTPPGTCYKVRIIRTDITPPIVGEASVCFEIAACPNTITTLQPVVLSNPLDTVCVGSVIDVPFWSTGVFTNNTYVAQLSDSSGAFPPNPNVLGTFPNSQTYDPTQVPSPGTVSGLINPIFHPIPPGCNYFIRVIGINPPTTGTLYGPFCIRECDITTNNKIDLKACLTNMTGLDTVITVDINTFDSTVVYNPGNQFAVQVFNSQNFGLVAQASYPNQPYIGTAVPAVANTSIPISVPTIPNLPLAGLQPGMYYVRAIGTNSNQMFNLSGTLIRLVIGAPNPTPLGIYSFSVTPPSVYIPPTIDTIICLNQGFYFYPTPFNSQSTYQWQLNGTNWANEFGIGIIFNGPGNYQVTVTETNNGCVGPGSDIAKIQVKDLPNVTIAGPLQVCVGDTAQFNVPLENNTYYAWDSGFGSVVDTSNNITTVYFPTVGNDTVYINAINICGTRNGYKKITVRPLPTVTAGSDTTICLGSEVSLMAGTGTGMSYIWYNNGTNVSTNQNYTFTPDSSMTLVLYGEKNWGSSLKCKNTDTINITVKNIKIVPPIDTTACENTIVDLNAGYPGASYIWNTGSTNQVFGAADSGSYNVVVKDTSEFCPFTIVYNVKWEICFKPLEFPNIFSPNGDGTNDNFFATSTFKYDEFYIEIYNRWGNVVFRSTDPFFQWDGKGPLGGEISDGVYFYVAGYKTSTKNETMKGTITIAKK